MIQNIIPEEYRDIVKSPSKYRAELLPFRKGTGKVFVKITDNGDVTKSDGAFTYEMEIKTDMPFIPSLRELQHRKFDLKSWLDNDWYEYDSPWLSGERDRVQDLINAESAESQFDLEIAKSIVDIINDKYHAIY